MADVSIVGVKWRTPGSRAGRGGQGDERDRRTPAAGGVGASAPAGIVLREYGFSADLVTARARRLPAG
ncbi:MAG: hypothetical protein ABIX12_01245 [Rubrivivax sp.]